MRCHSVACGMPNRMHRERNRATPSFAADHIDAVIRVYDEAGNVIETHEHAGELKEW